MADRERMHELIRDSPPWYKVPSLIKLYFLLIAPLLTSAAVGFENSLTNGLQSIDAFMDEFGHPTGSRLGFFGASVSVGGIVGCLICGPKQQAAAPVLVSELAHPKQRVSVTAFYNTNIFIGLIIGGWATFGTYPIESNWSWRLPCILRAIIPAYPAIMVWFCPESPRWLISKGRVEEARQILIKWHGDGVETELVRLGLQEIIAGIEADQTQIKLNWEGLKSVVGTKGNRHRLWICMWTAIGSQSIGGYTASYLPLILDQIGMRTQSQKTLINALLNVWNWIVAFIAAMIIPKVGRRTIFLVSALGTNVTFIIWTALSAEYDKSPRLGFGIGVLVMIFSGSFFTCLCWIPLVIAYPIEAVTTKQRITSAPSVLERSGGDITFHVSFWNLLLLVIIYFTFVETTGMTLEEIATIFDGDEAFENAAAAVGEDLTEHEEWRGY
ncbi:hypothetical protein CEP52_008274 [Fusarium oligoseptatum]|uniref:Major facilitator superfamily (MFS) profile domain-containing protein n=1 Tax=Fusarium oligoseptatum TaxID=2604345 RepID=A0A428TIU1_9HYPO|nr:hypothetical protein CEP52_008274 [Fusarium oligoseptatum]